ncbi:MAG: acetyl-CoA carboxylase biotin carboxylase subunit [Acidobacteria bacterium]|nr:acetyl-CoA carboxylase biotin carboxylase subunit [Acidobacteriota bacterium]
MFKKILIANRGEIACRIIWACKELGIQTVAVYSEPDRDALHVKLADQAVCVGPAAAMRSYLNIPAVISAAEVTDADAIHPGYGFLAESPHFAEVCTACSIKFIGPPAAIIQLMGDKARARSAMKSAGLPVVPGSDGPVKSIEEARTVAARIGPPVIIKAVAGGGGKGMRIVRSLDDLEISWLTAQNEAEAAFKNGELYIERYIEEPRHIEVQLLADEHGNVVHLGERECSIQRRYQKLIEESPSPALTEARRSEIGALAVQAAREIGYQNAGTMEFLFDSKDFYFMEMNTRIQVEHPVTEMVTNLDLVRDQILIADGQPLEFKQEDLLFSGHAIECRINAEDPDNFTPSPGRLNTFTLPGGPGVRVDTAVHSGSVVPPYYDSMVAKLIVRARTRPQAITRMRRALESFVVEGIKTLIPPHHRIMEDPDFIAGNFSTHFMERFLPARTNSKTEGGTQEGGGAGRRAR